MNNLRLTEVLLPMIAARARAPWARHPKKSVEADWLERGVAAARLGGGLAYATARRQLFDDVQ